MRVERRNPMAADKIGRRSFRTHRGCRDEVDDAAPKDFSNGSQVLMRQRRRIAARVADAGLDVTSSLDPRGAIQHARDRDAAVSLAASPDRGRGHSRSVSNFAGGRYSVSTVAIEAIRAQSLRWQKIQILQALRRSPEQVAADRRGDGRFHSLEAMELGRSGDFVVGWAGSYPPLGGVGGVISAAFGP